MPHTALLLIAHGSREDEANADLLHVVDGLKKLGRYPIVQPSFLELAEPNVEAGAELCVRQGATHVVMIPYFLSPGVHVRRDLSALCTALSARHPGVAFHLADPLGRHPLLLEVVAQRVREAEQKMAGSDFHGR